MQHLPAFYQQMLAKASKIPVKTSKKLAFISLLTGF